MPLHIVGSYPLGGINLAASASVDAMAPLLASFDLMLNSPFGLGGVSADLSLSFNASISASLQIALNLENPLIAIQLTLAGLANITAALTAAASLPGVPTLQISAQLAAAAATQAQIGVKLSGLQALISGALSVKNPAVDLLASLSASLAAGPVVVASWGFTDAPDTLATTGAEIEAAFSGGIGGLLPSDAVYGVLLVTKDLSASVGISSTLLVA